MSGHQYPHITASGSASVQVGDRYEYTQIRNDGALFVLGGSHDRCSSIPHEQFERVTRQLGEVQGSLQQLHRQPTGNDLQRDLYIKKSIHRYDPRYCRDDLDDFVITPPRVSAPRPPMPCDIGRPPSLRRDITEKARRHDPDSALHPAVFDGNAYEHLALRQIEIKFSLTTGARDDRWFTATILPGYVDYIQKIEFYESFIYIKTTRNTTTTWIAETRSNFKMRALIGLRGPWSISNSSIHARTSHSGFKKREKYMRCPREECDKRKSQHLDVIIRPRPESSGREWGSLRLFIKMQPNDACEPLHNNYE